MENVVSNTAATDFEALKLEVHLDYIEGPRDPIIAELLQEMVQNAKDCMRGGGSRRRALFVIGPSGSGKSYSLRHHLARIPGFQKGLNIHGEEVDPLLSIEAPKPCTTKDLAIAILKAFGIPARKRQTEGELFETVKTQLRERGILFLHIDEAQRTPPRRAALLRSEASWMICLYGRQYRQCENRGFNDRESTAS